ncbi:MAG: DUF2065 domain-containing protein [Alphaproteobacteria bacterium]|nr:DUF2065 domain-containing protein [Alphaproteobacteria bacterium]
MLDFLTAMGLVLVIEGSLYALFPDGLKRMMELAQSVPPTNLRMGGVTIAGVGVGLVWLVRA